MPDLCALSFLKDKRYFISRNSPANWRQIEDENETKNIWDGLRRLNGVNAFADAEFYNIAYPGYEGDLKYYFKQAVIGHNLYLGIGTGRIFSKIAQANNEIEGIDNSQEMVNHFKKAYPNLPNRVWAQNVLHAKLAKNSYDVIIAPYSFVQYFNKSDLVRLTKKIYSWLKPGGKFICDTFSPFLIPFRKSGLEVSARIQGDALINFFIKYDHFNQIMREVALITKNGVSQKVLKMTMSYFFPKEILEILQSVGFVKCGTFGDFKAKNFHPSTHEIIVYLGRK
jgi:SAM-dependent methyltransferase